MTFWILEIRVKPLRKYLKIGCGMVNVLGVVRKAYSQVYLLGADYFYILVGN